jgi:hypothetical protein
MSPVTRPVLLRIGALASPAGPEVIVGERSGAAGVAGVIDCSVRDGGVCGGVVAGCDDEVRAGVVGVELVCGLRTGGVAGWLAGVVAGGVFGRAAVGCVGVRCVGVVLAGGGVVRGGVGGGVAGCAVGVVVGAAVVGATADGVPGRPS